MAKVMLQPAWVSLLDDPCPGPLPRSPLCSSFLDMILAKEGAPLVTTFPRAEGGQIEMRWVG